MKKLLLSLCLVGISVSAMAQIPLLPTVFYTPKKEAVQDVKVDTKVLFEDQLEKVRTADRATPWMIYNFPEALEFYSGDGGQFSGAPLFWDSLVVLTDGSGGSFHWWQHGYASILDISSSYAWDWLDDVYPTELGTNKAEDVFNSAHAFDVDSASIFYTYRRDNPNAAVVDTLDVYVIEPGSGIIVTALTIDPGTGDTLDAVSTVRYAYLNNAPDISMAAGGTVTKYQFLLTPADSITTAYAAITVPCGFEIPVDPDPDDGVRPNLAAIAVHYKAGQAYATGDTLIDQTTPIGSVIPTGNPMNVFRLLTYEEDPGNDPYTTDERKYNMGALASSDVRYNISTSGWNGVYVSNFAYVDAFRNEHVYTSWLLRSKGVNFDWDNDGFCANGVIGTGMAVSFNDLTNFQPTPGLGTYSWDFGDGTGTSSMTDPSYEYQYAGAYDVTLVVSYSGDIYAQTRTINVPYCTVGVEEFSELNGFNVFPNPAKDVLYLEVELSEAIDYNITVQNMNGQVLHTSSVSNELNHISTLDVNSFPAGLYTISINSVDGSKSFTEKFMIGK